MLTVDDLAHFTRRKTTTKTPFKTFHVCLFFHVERSYTIQAKDADDALKLARNSPLMTSDEESETEIEDEATTEETEE